MAPVADEEPGATGVLDPEALPEKQGAESAPENVEVLGSRVEGESKESESEEEKVPDAVEKTSENVWKTESAFEDVGGGKEVDESAAESIAQPEVYDQAVFAAEEVKGPELTSDRMQTSDIPKEGGGADGDDKEGDKEGDDVVGALYERMGSVVASAQSEGGKKGEGGKDPVADSVISVAAPYIEYAVSQAQMLKNSVEGTTDAAVRTACNQLGELQDSSTTHYYYARDMFWRFQRAYREHENAFFSTLKDGVKSAAASPGVTALVATGAALVLFRRPRRFLFRHTLGRFRNREAALHNTKIKVDEMRQIVDVQKNEMKKLEERFRLGEDEFLRGQGKMAGAGTQIRSLVKKLYKTERQAEGLLDRLRDVPGNTAVLTRVEVASMASEVRKQREALDKDLYKIANYNIRV